MSDLIDRQAAIDALQNIINSGDEQISSLKEDTAARLAWQLKRDSFCLAIHTIKAVPSTQPERKTEYDYSDGFADGYRQGQKDAERKTGRWIKREILFKSELKKNQRHLANIFYQCSECERLTLQETRYCPNCGSPMEVKHD